MRDTPDTVAALWDRQAGWYDRTFDARSGDAHALQARLRKTIELVGPGPGALLDAGMGPGRLCAGLAHRGWTVHGVDSAREMVELARARLPEAADRLVEGSIERIPFPDLTFDCVTATGVLEYAAVPAALAELARVLRPGGLAVISYPNPRAPYRAWKAWLVYPVVRALRPILARGGQAPRPAPAIAPRRFTQLLEGSGLVALARFSTSVIPVPAPLDVLFPRATARLAGRLERVGSVRRLLATQVVYTARKP